MVVVSIDQFEVELSGIVLLGRSPNILALRWPMVHPQRLWPDSNCTDPCSVKG